MKKTLVLYRGDELVIQSNEFSYPLCNFLSEHFTHFITLSFFVFYVLYQMRRIKCRYFVTPPCSGCIAVLHGLLLLSNLANFHTADIFSTGFNSVRLCMLLCSATNCALM